MTAEQFVATKEITRTVVTEMAALIQKYPDAKDWKATPEQDAELQQVAKEICDRYGVTEAKLGMP